MSPNELETMSQPHTLNGESNMDVSNPDGLQIAPPTDSLPTPQVPAVDSIRILSPQNSKSVKLGETKRRKVSIGNPSLLSVGRQTRSGAGNSRLLSVSRSVVPKYKTVDQMKDEALSTRKRKLQQTYEAHDSKVRELFHLTKFITLADYDAKAAKEDKSEVFNEV